MPVTWATVLIRIREQLVETSPDYFLDLRLRDWYDDGAAAQHRMVLENAVQTGKAQAYNSPYLKHFLKSSSATAFVAGQFDYTLPTDFYMLIGAEVTELDGTEHDCRVVSIGDDWRIRNLPNWRPIPERPYVALTDDGKARFYFDSPDLAPPDAALKYSFTYYRDVTRTTGVNVDLEDPHNIGPIAFAVGKGKEKQNVDPGHWFAQAQAAVNIIMPAPAQASR